MRVAGIWPSTSSLSTTRTSSLSARSATFVAAVVRLRNGFAMERLSAMASVASSPNSSAALSPIVQATRRASVARFVAASAIWLVT